MLNCLRARTAVASVALALAALAGTTAISRTADAQETLRVGTWAMPGGRGNPYTARGTPSIFAWTPIFDKLTAIDKDGAVIPEFAASWRNVNPTTWQFTLRDGAKFSNGQVLDANAVKANFEWLLSADGKATAVGQWINELDSVSVVDAKTVQFVTKAGNPIWPKRIAVVMMVEPKAWTDLGVAGFSQAPVGSGAYKLARLAPESYSYEANDLSWRKRENISKIELLALSEAAARNQALLSGQIDVDTDASFDNFAALRAANLRVDTINASNTHGLTILQTKDGPFKDKRVRQAANYAVDKDAIVKNVYGGLGAPSSQHATPISFGYNKDLKPYPYDVTKAKQLLTEAGFPNGVDMVIEGVQVAATLSNMYQAVANYLNAAGIRAQVKIVPINEYVQKFLGGGYGKEVDAIGSASDHTGHLDAGVGFSSFYSCSKRNPVYCDEAEQVMVKAAETEFDLEKRRKILGELLKVNAENASLIFVAEQTNNMAYNPKVKNFKNAVFVLNYHEMRIEK
ncbi:MAG: ABC transporter substrate-binding protein [Alphaproteobacteria bacterium]|nr:ABC transporter substrate-binding protein [Alphaproteobacteria bacterium]